jgi:hypothetical protein
MYPMAGLCDIELCETAAAGGRGSRDMRQINPKEGRWAICEGEVQNEIVRG